MLAAERSAACRCPGGPPARTPVTSRPPVSRPTRYIFETSSLCVSPLAAAPQRRVPPRRPPRAPPLTGGLVDGRGHGHARLVTQLGGAERVALGLPAADGLVALALARVLAAGLGRGRGRTDACGLSGARRHQQQQQDRQLGWRCCWPSAGARGGRGSSHAAEPPPPTPAAGGDRVARWSSQLVIPVPRARAGRERRMAVGGHGAAAAEQIGQPLGVAPPAPCTHSPGCLVQRLEGVGWGRRATGARREPPRGLIFKILALVGAACGALCGEAGEDVDRREGRHPRQSSSASVLAGRACTPAPQRACTICSGTPSSKH